MCLAMSPKGTAYSSAARFPRVFTWAHIPEALQCDGYAFTDHANVHRRPADAGCSMAFLNADGRGRAHHDGAISNVDVRRGLNGNHVRASPLPRVPVQSPCTSVQL